MWTNYLKIALRNLRRRAGYTLINIAGLAVAMAACLLIILYLQEELSYDEFHEHAERIVAIGNDARGPRRLSNPYLLASALEDNVPDVEEAVSTESPGGPLRLSADGETFQEIKSLFTEPDFFEVFSFRLLRGDPRRALSAPNSVTLTRPVARQLFGNEDPTGQPLYWHLPQRDTTFTLQVTGVAADPPSTTTLSFEALLSIGMLEPSSSWRAFGYQTYALLRSPEDINAMPRHLSALAEQHYDEEHRPSYFAEPLTALHLSPLTSEEGFTGEWRYLYLFGSIALVILLIACINYVNLSTARAGQRAREVGIRKTIGASRLQVARQFLGESLLLTLGALALAIGLVEAALPAFNRLFGTHLDLVYHENILFLGTLLGLVGVVGLAAGSYPALYLSRFDPTRVLQEHAGGGRKGALLRRGLVAGQFALSAMLLISTFVIYQQLAYTQNKDHGFEKERLLVAELRGGWGLGDAPGDRIWRLRQELRREVQAHPAVTEATIASGAPGKFFSPSLRAQPGEMSPAANASDSQPFEYAQAVVDYDFLETMEISLVAGRNFSEEHSSDQKDAYIINEAAAAALGWTPQEALGQPLRGHPFRDATGPVIGVTENFHLESLHEPIPPVVLQLHEPSSWAGSGVLMARLRAGSLPEGIDYIGEQITRYGSGGSFEYTFLDDRFAAMYRTERRLARVLISCTLVAVFIACLGLFGLAAYMAERRTREIGIRKALGASVANIVGLLSKDFTTLVGSGFAVATPAAYFFMHRWLQDFAYHITLGPGIFLLAGIVVVAIAFLAVSYQSIKAALTNPAESLRYE